MTPKLRKGVSHETHTADDSVKKKTLKVILVDDVSASVFAFEHEGEQESRTYYSVSFSRSYLDGDGKRQYVKFFNLEDLGKVVRVAQMADEYIRSLMKPEIEA